MPSGRRARLQKLRDRVLQKRREGALQVRLADWAQAIKDEGAAATAPTEPTKRWPCPNREGGCTGQVTRGQDVCRTCGARIEWPGGSAS